MMGDLLKILVIIVLVGATILGAMASCYQEQANESVVCGGFSSGSYASSGPFNDGNWSTHKSSLSGGFIAVNYTVPTTNSGVWHMKYSTFGCEGSAPTEEDYEEHSIINNYTISPSCYVDGVLSIYVVTTGGIQIHDNIYCGEGVGIDSLLVADGWMACAGWGRPLQYYEEAMDWNMENMSCAPEWSCSGYGSECLETDQILCNQVADLHQCGEEYIGNFSEFTPLECDYCEPDWNCTEWGTCVNETKNCTHIEDLNTCGETYGGDYSEFEAGCTSKRTSSGGGYVPPTDIVLTPNVTQPVSKPITSTLVLKFAKENPMFVVEIIAVLMLIFFAIYSKNKRGGK